MQSGKPSFHLEVSEFNAFTVHMCIQESTSCPQLQLFLLSPPSFTSLLLFPMVWATVGYHAVEQKVFDAALRQESEGDWFCGMSLQSWFPSPLCAISQTRKENVRKLGLSLSETVDPPKGKVSKRLPGKTVVDAALECPNYVVWRLQTTENIAELLSQGFLRAGKNKFELQTALEPFLPFGQADKWQVDYSSLVSMPATILPTLCEKPNNTMFFGGDSKFACSYFLAMPVTHQNISLPELLTINRAAPLLKLLLHNEKSEEMKILLENCMADRGDYVGLPLVSSPITAMVMGFFAYKPLTVQEQPSQPLKLSQQSESEPLHLLHFCAKALVDLHPPNSHPLCPFWLFKPDGLMQRIAKGEMTLKVQHFYMKVNLTAEYQSQMALLKRSQKAKMLNKKRRLQDDIKELEADIRDKKLQMDHIMGQLPSTEEPLPEPALPTASPSNAEA
eukprot:s326_g49.t1